MLNRMQVVTHGERDHVFMSLSINDLGGLDPEWQADERHNTLLAYIARD